MTELDLAALILRVWLGIVMIAHGLNHARSLEGTGRWFRKVGFSSAKLNAWMSAGVEIAIGVALVLGLLTPFAAAGVAATMLVAFWSIHRFVGFFVFHRPDEGYEFVATLTVVALAIALLGPGRVSLDAALEIAEDFNPALGATVFAFGLLAAAVQLAVFWRRPSGKESGD